MNRSGLALAAYWVLFIIIPMVASFWLLGPSIDALRYCLPIFVVLCLIGEHGFRRWKRLWKVE